MKYATLFGIGAYITAILTSPASAETSISIRFHQNANLNEAGREDARQTLTTRANIGLDFLMQDSTYVPPPDSLRFLVGYFVDSGGNEVPAGYSPGDSSVVVSPGFSLHLDDTVEERALIEDYIISEILHEIRHEFQYRTERFTPETRSQCEANAIDSQQKFWKSRRTKNELKNPKTQELLRFMTAAKQHHLKPRDRN